MRSPASAADEARGPPAGHTCKYVVIKLLQVSMQLACTEITFILVYLSRYRGARASEPSLLCRRLLSSKHRLVTKRDTHKKTNRNSTMEIFSATDVLRKGLALMGIRIDGRSKDLTITEFGKHFGSSPTVIAAMWYDLQTTDILDAQLSPKENTEAGFNSFMKAHYFLWTYEKNSHLLASRFNTCERYCRGEPLWRWIKKIAALVAAKIGSPDDFFSGEVAIHAVTQDGVDFKMWEKKHPIYNMDPKQCSKKFNHGAVKYLIAISVFHAKVVFYDGPYRGGMHDLEMFRKKLKGLLAQYKKVAISDRGFRSSDVIENKLVSLPDGTDSKGLANFKSRARLRHETFNGRMKFFRIFEAVFKLGEDKHKIAFEAVLVIVQYQMDNGSPIFAV
jgi:hypothetical protein